MCSQIGILAGSILSVLLAASPLYGVGERLLVAPRDHAVIACTYRLLPPCAANS
jgi:hypothetical protein